MSDHPTVYVALGAVMGEVQAVRKTDRNANQNYAFRGIDAVMNAVGPALRKHGVIVVPTVLEESSTPTTSSKGAPMTHVRVRVRYTFYGPGGDSIECSVPGEAMDSGDKATPKAMSVAFRTALLQSLCLPTDEPDPDHFTYEQGAAPTEAQKARAREGMAAVPGSDTEALRGLWSQYGDVLEVEVDGTTLRTAIVEAKGALDAAAGSGE